MSQIATASDTVSDHTVENTPIEEDIYPAVTLKTAPPKPLPGDRSMAEDIERMIRVDHAGEFGAVRIYEGQLAILGSNHPKSALIRHMKSQEDEHLKRFSALIAKRGIRPTALSPFWDIAGFSLGAVTALIGEKAAMACTVAVEEVIEDHYQEQLDQLTQTSGENASEAGKDPELISMIRQFQAEEVEHKETAKEHGAEQALGYPVLSGLIKTGCRAAIWLAKRT